MKNNQIFIIAEAGVNHNGSIKKAKKLVDIAKDAGADAVKFQTWKTESLVSYRTQAPYYQKINTGEQNQFKILKKLELNYSEFDQIIDYCSKKKIKFMSTADDVDSANYLRNRQDVFKIGSGELDNFPFLDLIISFNKPIILSTGCADKKLLDEVIKNFKKRKFDLQKLTLLHCTSAYPVPYNEVNLNVIESLKKYGVSVGFSDHTLDNISAIGAVALGAKVVEKHFTISNQLEGPDHKMSLNPSMLKKFIKDLRNIELCLGSKTKTITRSEKKNMKIFRKSIFSSTLIKKDNIITIDNLTFKRPGFGISPKNLKTILGKRAKKNIPKDKKLKIDDFY